jgi:transposase-like protein
MRSRAGDHAQSAANTEVLEQLRKRFRSFRALRGARKRVPLELRRAVLDALAEGVSSRALRRELGITPMQLSAWRRSDAATAQSAPTVKVPRARVFEVTDPAQGESHGAQPGGGDALELRLGGWSLVIRAPSGALS